MPRPRAPGGGNRPAGWRLRPRTRYVRSACFCSYALLLAQQVYDLWLGGAPWVVWLALLLPLLLFLPGILRDRPRSFIWLCFVSLLYFMRLVVDLFASPACVSCWVGMFAVVVLFCSAMFYVRWRAQEWRASTPKEKLQ